MTFSTPAPGEDDKAPENRYEYTLPTLPVLFLVKKKIRFFLESEIVAKIKETDEEQVQDIINNGKVKL